MIAVSGVADPEVEMESWRGASDESHPQSQRHPRHVQWQFGGGSFGHKPA